MKLKHTKLSAAVLAGSLTMAMSSIAVAQPTGMGDPERQGPRVGAEQSQQVRQDAQMRQGSGTVSILVGHDIVDALDDVRETTADFLGALMEADEGLGLGNWEQKEVELNQLEARLEEMETVLDEKAEATDEGWLDWVGGPEYGVTVRQQVQTIGNTLEQVASMLSDSWNTTGMQLIVGNNVVAQLEDLRETTEDLLNAVENTGPEYGWTIDRQSLQQARQVLQQMERKLDRKAEMTDANWGTYVTSPEYSIMIHETVRDLAQILNNLMPQSS